MAKAKKKPLASLAIRVKTDPALLARAQKDPGLRSKLPDKFLDPTQLAARKRRQYLANLGDISTPLTGQSMVDTAQQITNSDYAPLLAGVGQQETIVNKSAGLQGDWAKRYYGDLDSLIGGIGTAQAGANSASVQAAKDAGTATQAAITGADQDAQKRMAADAAVRGGGLQGDAVANQAARTATASQGATADAGRATTAAQQSGDTQAAFLRGLQGTTAQQGGEYQQQITGAQGAALAQLAQRRKELASKQAGSFTDTLLKLRSGEQQNEITQVGLGMKQDAATAAAASAGGAGGQKYGYTPAEWLALPAAARTGIVAAANKKAPKAKATTGYGAGLPGMNKYGYTYDEWTGLDTKAKSDARKGKGKKSGSGTTDDATNVQVGDAQTAAETAIADAKKAGISLDPAHRHQLASYLLHAQQESSSTVNQKTKDGSVSTKIVRKAATNAHDPLFASVALDVLLDGHVSHYNANRLHSRGLTVEDLGYKSATQAKKSAPSKYNRPVNGT
jgi:hypothetical protein